ncbi:MAG: hypothetical protein PHP31_07565 [Lentimicrobiaceae bacterium]|nr:hypothetical protein [Lentimicrobiaceae bacterium]
MLDLNFENLSFIKKNADRVLEVENFWDDNLQKEVNICFLGFYNFQLDKWAIVKIIEIPKYEYEYDEEVYYNCNVKETIIEYPNGILSYNYEWNIPNDVIKLNYLKKRF